MQIIIRMKIHKTSKKNVALEGAGGGKGERRKWERERDRGKEGDLPLFITQWAAEKRGNMISR